MRSPKEILAEMDRLGSAAPSTVEVQEALRRLIAVAEAAKGVQMERESYFATEIEKRFDRALAALEAP